MNSSDSPQQNEGITLRQAAVIAGLGYLLMPAALAEFSLYPKVVVQGNVAQTVENIFAHGRIFVAAILCYLITIFLDVVIAWALYYLLAPVNRALSMLTAWFRLVYVAIFFVASLNLVHVYRILNTPDYLALFGADRLRAQVQLALDSFRWDWSFSLIIFAIHLCLLGYLIFRSGYIPRVIGILLVINGLGWIVDCLRPYLYPNAHLRFIFATFLGELVFMVWLLVRGWKIVVPPVHGADSTSSS